MAVVSFVAILVTLGLVPGSSLSPNSEPLALSNLILFSLAGSLVATAAEGLSPGGTDNLSVPLTTGLTLYLLRIWVA
jgi:dolichol kinase